MRLWRICRRPYADLSGSGAKLRGGRWNSPGRAVVYTADSAALAALEVRVHLDLSWDLLPDDFVLIEMETASVAMEALTLPTTDKRVLGDAWLESRRSLLLRVPSAIVPESYNILINPEHPSAIAEIEPVSMRSFTFDSRLWLPRL